MHTARAEAQSAQTRLHEAQVRLQESQLRVQELAGQLTSAQSQAASLDRRLREADERIAHLKREREIESARHRAQMSDLRESSAEVQVLREQLSTTLTSHVEEVEQLRLMLIEQQDKLEVAEAKLALEIDKGEETATQIRDAAEVEAASRILIDLKNEDLAIARARISELEARITAIPAPVKTAPPMTRAAAAGFSGSATSGSTIGFPAPAAPQPAGRTFSAAQLSGALDELLFTQRIEFTGEGASIRRSSEAILDEVGALLDAAPNAVVRIEAHTDAWGDPELNLELSQIRAHAVRDYLMRKGHPARRFVCAGYGDSRPIDDNSSPEGRWRNRRVEFRVLPQH
jgi:outer membrane protein OmpA-like peptidoglycan-associated protein